jgi:predicted lysophospholipase L1 biosynthesis ABC-type transport system permease subunit
MPPEESPAFAELHAATLSEYLSCLPQYHSVPIRMEPGLPQQTQEAIGAATVLATRVTAAGAVTAGIPARPTTTDATMRAIVQPVTGADIDRLALRYTGSAYPERAHRRVSMWMAVDIWHGWDATGAIATHADWKP